MTTIYDENGKYLGLKDICKWILETYPQDIPMMRVPGIMELCEGASIILAKLNEKEVK